MGWKVFKLAGVLGVFGLGVALQAQAIGFLDNNPNSPTFGQDAFPTDFPLATGRNTAIPTLYQCAGGNLTQILRNSAGSRDIGFDEDEEEDKDDGAFTQSFLAGVGVPCPEVGDFDKKVACDEILVGGKLDADRVKDARARARQAYNAMNCKQRRLAAVEAELNSCVKPQISAITQMMEGIQAGYEREIEQSKKQITELKSWEADRTAQDQELGGLLEGTPTSPGMLRMKEQHLKLTDQLGQDKLIIKNAWAQVTIERNKLTEFRSIREATLMGECFKTRVVSSDHKCSPGEAATTPLGVLLCRYEQNLRIGDNGRIGEDGITKREASVQRQSLEQLMTKIFGDLPDKGRLPTSTAEGPDFVNQSITVLSPDEVDRKFGAQLKGLNANGIDVYAFTMANLRACYARGQGIVLREMARDNTQLGQMKLGIQRIERESQSVIERALTKYQDHYAEVIRAFRSNGGLNVDACRVQREDVQNACFEDIKTKYDGLMNGPLVMPPISIRSASSGRPQTNLGLITLTGNVIRCEGRESGLSNCIQKIEKIRGIVQRDIGSLKQKKQETVEKTNNEMKKSFSGLATQFSRMTRSAADVMEKLKGALASLGVKGVRINQTEMPSANLAPNADGLLEIPDGANAMQVVNSMMDPKLPNLSGGMFDGVLDAVGAENKDLANKKREAFSAYNRINTDALACQKAKVDSIVAKADRDIAELKAKCDLIKENCAPGSRDAVSQLQTDLSGVSFFGDEVTGSLQSGLANLCTESRSLDALIAQKRAEIETAERADAAKLAGLTAPDGATPEEKQAIAVAKLNLSLNGGTAASKKTELAGLEAKRSTGELASVDCASIRRRVGSSLKELKKMDGIARDLAGEAE